MHCITCADVNKVLGITIECCPSCHEDVELGYGYLSGDTEHWSVCCTVFDPADAYTTLMAIDPGKQDHIDAMLRYCFASFTAERIHFQEKHTCTMRDCVECKSGFALLLSGPKVPTQVEVDKALKDLTDALVNYI